MKKILILAYDFPPYISVAGHRPQSWYEHFYEFDLYPVVITRQWDNKFGNHLDYIAPGYSNQTVIEAHEKGTIIRTPFQPNFSNRLLMRYGFKRFSLLRKFFTGWHEIFQWFFFTGPKVAIYREALDYIRKNKIDAIIATGGPFILFRYARILSRNNNIPWIADYRDPWVNGVILEKNAVFNPLMKYFEKKIINKASYITTVSVFLQDCIKLNVENRKFLIIPNGYNQEIDFTMEEHSSDKFVISFAGSLLSYHPVEIFLSGFSEFVSEAGYENVELNFYGISNEERILHFIVKHNPLLNKCVRLYKKIPNQELMKKLTQSNLLLLFNDYAVTGTKIYDYLVARRNMLFCFDNDGEAEILRKKYYLVDSKDIKKYQMQKDLIQETNSGVIVNDKAHLKQVLKDLFHQFRQTGKIECHSAGVENYSRKIQAERLANLVHDILKEDTQ